MTTLRVAPAYRDAVKVALALQAPVMLLLLLMLDGGMAAMIGACVMAGFWIGAAVIMFRRPQDPKPLDLIYLKWGYAPLLYLALMVAVAWRSS